MHEKLTSVKFDLEEARVSSFQNFLQSVISMNI